VLLDRLVKPGDDREGEDEAAWIPGSRWRPPRNDGQAYFRREIGTYSRSVGPV
jgi:hypothetical protein